MGRQIQIVGLVDLLSNFIIHFGIICHLKQIQKNFTISFAVDTESTSNDTHTDKIQEIRETIRRKRCVDRGEVYKPPDEVN